jgi:hypothetical protein
MKNALTYLAALAAIVWLVKKFRQKNTDEKSYANMPEVLFLAFVPCFCSFLPSFLLFLPFVPSFRSFLSFLPGGVVVSFPTCVGWEECESKAIRLLQETGIGESEGEIFKCL